MAKKFAETYEGAVCKRCGGTTRYESNGGCVSCTLTRKSPEQKREYNRRYYSQNKAQQQEYKKEWNRANKEKRKEQSRRWHSENRAGIRELRRASYPENRERVLERNRKSANINWPRVLLAGCNKRAKRRKDASSSEVTITKEWVERQPLVCPYTTLRLVPKNEDGRVKRPDQPSLDRIDNSKGYTPENTRLTSWFWNCFRGDLSVEEATARLIEHYRALLQELHDRRIIDWPPKPEAK